MIRGVPRRPNRDPGRQPVQPKRRALARAVGGALLVSATSLAAREASEPVAPPAASRGEVALPTGVAIDSAPRPASAAQPFCSFVRPVCVQAAGNDGGALAALDALEQAYERIVLALGLPEPLPDGLLGGSAALDAYLVPADRAFSSSADPPLAGPFARASTFCRLPATRDPFLMQRAATLCVAEAVANALDSAETPGLRRGFGTFLWWVTGLPTALDFEAIDDVQRHPERPIAGRELSEQSEGSALFFEYLEHALGVAGPADLAASLFAAAASPRPAGLHYDNEPDLFDVLRHTLDSNRFRFARLMSDFAVSRAFVGSREDGLHLPMMRWAGAFGRPRFDWVIPFSSLPRRVAVKPPIDSTGTVLVWLELDALPERTSLGFQAEWEAPVTFDWQLVRLGPNGEELGRVAVPFEERGTSVEATIGHLGGVSAVLAVGTNLETVELAHPFDPDVSPYEPHGVTLYFAKL